MHSSSKVTSDLNVYFQNSNQANEDHVLLNSQLAITGIAQSSFEEISKPKKIIRKSLRIADNTLSNSKSYYKYFKCDIEIHEQIRELMKDNTQNSLNQMKDLMRKSPLLKDYKIMRLIEWLPQEDLLILKKLIQICQYENFDYQNAVGSSLFDMYLQEVESWSILFNRCENFELYLSDTLTIRENRDTGYYDMTMGTLFH